MRQEADAAAAGAGCGPSLPGDRGQVGKRIAVVSERIDNVNPGQA
jgi:hypothetical protein